jgi:hypothetical protein
MRRVLVTFWFAALLTEFAGRPNAEQAIEQVQTVDTRVLTDIYGGDITEPWRSNSQAARGTARGVLIGIFKERDAVYVDGAPCNKQLFTFRTSAALKKTSDSFTCTGRSGKNYQLPAYAVTATQ